jgi:hypothetical protein
MAQLSYVSLVPVGPVISKSGAQEFTAPQSQLLVAGMGTLLDEDGVCDLRHPNDRLLLGTLKCGDAFGGACGGSSNRACESVTDASASLLLIIIILILLFGGGGFYSYNRGAYGGRRNARFLKIRETLDLICRGGHVRLCRLFLYNSPEENTGYVR